MRLSHLILAPAALGLLFAAATPTTKAANPPPPAATTAPAATPTPQSTTTAPAKPININTASLEELDTLPQIGKARRAAIAGGRPYKDTKELVSKGILSQGIYDKIKDKITVQ